MTKYSATQPCPESFADSMDSELLCHPYFVCQSCGKQNVIEVDTTEGFPQTFVWDCERCCHAHEITVREHDGERLEILAKLI